MAARPKGQGARAMLREMILSGKFKPGVYLPSIRKLAEELDVTKSTVHVILTMLQKEGLVQMQPGRRGVVVVDYMVRKNTLRHLFVRSSEVGYFGKSPESVKTLGGLCCAAEKRNVELTISFSDSINIINEIIELYRNDIIQGIVYMECGDSDSVKQLESLNIPYVVMNDDSAGLDCVKCVQDFRNVARQAVYYLTRRGHRKIGMMLGSPDSYLYSEFNAGFRGALAEEKLEYNQSWLIQTGSYQDKDKYMNDVIGVLKSGNRPTAFFTARDYRAAILYKACELLNLKIPEDISVISYDDITWDEGPGKGLTTFSQPAYELGEATMDMLYEWVTTGERVSNRKVENMLIERLSVCNANKKDTVL